MRLMAATARWRSAPSSWCAVSRAAMAHPDWEAERPGIEATAGAGNARVTLGAPPQVPKPDPPGGIERQPAKGADEIAVEAALPEGKNRAPVSGFLYFIYTGRTRSIKQVELLYRDTSLKLR